MRHKNFLLFFVLSFLLFITWLEVKRRVWPVVPPASTPTVPLAKLIPPEVQRPLFSLTQLGLPDVNRNAVQGVTAAAVATLSTAPSPPSAVASAASAAAASAAAASAFLSTAPTSPRGKPFTLGDANPVSKYHLRVIVNSLGGTVHSVLLNKFQATDDHGRPAWKDDEHKVPAQLELVPERANKYNPSHQLLNYDPPDLGEERPVDTLGRIEWSVVEPQGKPLAEADLSRRGVHTEGDKQSISFRTVLPDRSVEIIKTYTVKEGDYHIGLEVKMIPQGKTSGGKEPRFRYQLTGAHGLPIEGKWYTGIFHNALIAEEENGTVYREIEDIRQLINWNGGAEVRRQQGRILRYAGVAIQYFASVIVVDNEHQKKQDFLVSARPTLETTLVRGQIKSLAPAQGTFVVTTGDATNPELTFHVDWRRFEPRWEELKAGFNVAVTYVTDSHMHYVPIDIAPMLSEQPVWVDDVTVRVSTDTVEFKDNEPVVHRYLLYNGPVKPSLLGYMPASDRPSQELIDRYAYALHLNTLTDYHMPGWFGSFLNSVYWSTLVIKCTNLMHWMLAHLYYLIPNYGLCILLLTVMVRGLMFPFSRKQALMGLRMQELAPEMKKLQEKHKDDRQALGVAQMELYRKHDINPFGTCWLLLLQMPIFMGLYYALMESIQFRLAPFWPTWIVNLAAPDMLWYWGEKVPWISRPEDYGGMLYLGPYLNLLPIIAIILTMMMQKMMTPPPTDEQQEMQQKMMKYMMIFVGLMFYKMAAGLCIYFIASSLWGFAERKFLPKKKIAPGAVSANGPPSRSTGPAQPAVSSAGAEERARRGKQKRNRRRDRGQREGSAPISFSAPPAEEAVGALGKLRAWWKARRERWGEWWAEVRKRAEKK